MSFHVRVVSFHRSAVMSQRHTSHVLRGDIKAQTGPMMAGKACRGVRWQLLHVCSVKQKKKKTKK